MVTIVIERSKNMEILERLNDIEDITVEIKRCVEDWRAGNGMRTYQLTDNWKLPDLRAAHAELGECLNWLAHPGLRCPPLTEAQQ